MDQQPQFAIGTLSDYESHVLDLRDLGPPYMSNAGWQPVDILRVPLLVPEQWL